MDAAHRRIALALVPLAAAVALPFLSTFQLGKALVVGPLLALLLVQTRKPSPGVGALGPALALCFAASLPALLRAASPSAAAWELWFDLLFAGGALLGARLGGAAPGRAVLAAAAAAALTMFAATAWCAAGLPAPCGAAAAGAGTMGNPNFAAAVCALGVPALLALAAAQRRRERRAVAAASVAALTATLVVLDSCLGWVAAAGGAAVAAIVLLVARGRRRAALLVAVAGIATAAGALALPAAHERLAGRAFLARVALDAAADAPLLGHGLGGFSAAFADAQGRALRDDDAPRELWTRALHPHVEALHVLVERGALGLAGLLAVWGTIALGVVRRVRSPAPRNGGRGDAEGTAGLAGVLAAGVLLSLGEFPGHLVPVQLLLGLAAGVLGAREAERRTRGRRLAGRAVALALGVALAAVPAWRAASDALAVRGAAEAALRVDPWNAVAATALGLREQDGTAPTGCARLERALRLAPSPALATALGNCRARRGERDAARNAFRTAVFWNPRHAAAHAGLALMLARAGDVAGARGHAARAQSLRPGDRAIRVLAGTARRLAAEEPAP